MPGGTVGAEPAADAGLVEWLAFIEAQHPLGAAGIKLGLERVGAVRDALNIAPKFPVIAVAGTNGKGSTCAYLESVLLASGYRVGCYTSPHLHHYTERIRIGGLPVEEMKLVAAFAAVEAARKAAGAIPLTYFEYGTLAAWLLFAWSNVEVAILEVGLGGRLDAVNAFDADVSIVTGIALDHTDWLGATREAIGQEKAGIFRSTRPALCADPDPPQTLLAHATSIGADLRLIGRDFGFFIERENQHQWQWWCRSGAQIKKMTLAYPGLRGTTQLMNASVALAALDTLSQRLPVPAQGIRQGLIKTELSGRFQVLPGRPSIVLDVGHNPQAVNVLADNLDSMGFFSKTHAVLGMLADKDAENALRHMKGKIDFWYLATLEGTRGSPASRLACTIESLGLGGVILCHDSPEEAMLAAKERADESDRIVAFGSFLTVAGAMSALARSR